MEKLSFDMFSGNEPMDQLIKLYPKTKPDTVLVDLSVCVNKMLSQMVTYWEHQDNLYKLATTTTWWADDGDIKKEVDSINLSFCNSYTGIVKMMAIMAESGDYISLALAQELEDRGLQALQFSTNALKTLLALGTHIITHEENVPLYRLNSKSVKYNDLDPFSNRKAARSIDPQLYELSHKTSNEICITGLALRGVLIKAVSDPKTLNSTKLKSLITKFFISHAIHWAAHEADDLYLNIKTYELIQSQRTNF